MLRRFAVTVFVVWLAVAAGGVWYVVANRL
jgi:hypothetical protein